MERTRRSFLTGMLGVAAAVAVAPATLEFDPERALWLPGAKKIFVPPVTGWTASREVWASQKFSRVLLRALEDGLYAGAFVAGRGEIWA